MELCLPVGRRGYRPADFSPGLEPEKLEVLRDPLIHAGHALAAAGLAVPAAGLMTHMGGEKVNLLILWGALYHAEAACRAASAPGPEDARFPDAAGFHVSGSAHLLARIYSPWAWAHRESVPRNKAYDGVREALSCLAEIYSRAASVVALAEIRPLFSRTARRESREGERLDAAVARLHARFPRVQEPFLHRHGLTALPCPLCG